MQNKMRAICVRIAGGQFCLSAGYFLSLCRCPIVVIVVSSSKIAIELLCEPQMMALPSAARRQEEK